MPTVNLRCMNGHESYQYVHTWERLYSELTRLCDCGHPYIVRPSFGTPLTYFSEKSPRTIQNLGGATIRSHGEHVRTMKEQGVEPALEWHTSKRKLSDGIVPRAPREHPKKKLLG